MMKIKNSLSGTIFDCLNTIFLIFMGFVTLYPFWYELCVSFSSPQGVMRGGLYILPREFTLMSYFSVFMSRYIWRAFNNSVFVTFIGTILSIFITCSIAYPMSKKSLPGNRLLSVFVIITLLFNGGIIPLYLAVKSYHLLNSFWAIIIIHAAAPFSVIVMKNFFTGISQEIEESAYMDGAGPIVIFFLIILPLSLPAIATIALWSSVGLWNDFFRGIMFINDKSKYLLPVLLRDIIGGQDQNGLLPSDGRLIETTTQSIIAATVIVALTPIICVYPFLQRYFVKGVLVGAVKG